MQLTLNIAIPVEWEGDPEGFMAHVTMLLRQQNVYAISYDISYDK